MGSGLLGASAAKQAAVVRLLEEGAAGATMLSGPMPDDSMDLVYGRGGPVESICSDIGFRTSSSFQFSTVYCINILFGMQQAEGKDVALVSVTPPTSIFDRLPQPIYLVNLPAGTVGKILELITPDPYESDAYRVYFGTESASVGSDLKPIFRQIDEALPGMTKLRDLTDDERDALLDASRPAVEWAPGGRLTNLPPAPGGSRVFSVTVLAGPDSDVAIVTFDYEIGPKALYRVGPSLTSAVRAVFSSGTTSTT